MQLMSWIIGRLGSRFSLVFEPYQQRVLHSAVGRFLDSPLDLMVGLIEPDGAERVLPFTQRGTPLFVPEQFERLNSITFRGHSERYRLRFELNVHNVFYPQDEELCTMPAFYLEMRVSPSKHIRWHNPVGRTPDHVKLFIRLQRPDTQITASARNNGQIDLAYRESLTPKVTRTDMAIPPLDAQQFVSCAERIVSLNPGCEVHPQGDGLTLELPVTEPGSGTKWRLVWAAHVAEPVLQFHEGQSVKRASFRYLKRLADIDAVVDEAVRLRDERLAHSRRFEKLFDQVPLRMAQRHLIHLSFQSFLSNTFWCDVDDGSSWFSVWEGRCFYHSTIDVEYNVSLLYLAMWPDLLVQQFDQWARYTNDHESSQGQFLSHDMGQGAIIRGLTYNHHMPVEENSNYLLMLQAYSHQTGDLGVARRHADLIQKLTNYLIWTDRDDTGFPSEGTANTLDDANPAMQYARKQTYLAVKRLAAIRAAGDLLGRLGRKDFAARCEALVERDANRIDEQAWLGEHYAVCADRSTEGIRDAWTGEPLPYDEMPGWDAYSIYTGNGLLLPAMVGQALLLDVPRLRDDLANACRETLSPYGCGHTSLEPENVWISQNLWRDHLARYLGMARPHLTQRYWDMLVAANTHHQSKAFIDTYVTNNLSFYPRGIASIGFLSAEPRLVIDRLAAGGQAISVQPDRTYPQRWPLLPLADWKAGKIPVCVVDAEGQVSIENESDPIIIRGEESTETSVIG